MSKTALLRILTAATALVAATALGAAPAQASPTTGTVKLSIWGLEFTAGPGATNKISAAGTLDHFFYFIDEKNDVRMDPSAGNQCVQVTAKSVRCTGITFATFALGDNPDTFYVEGYVPVFVQGGPASDTLTAKTSSAHVYLFGQDGSDKLVGGEADDLLDAGPGIQQSTAGGLGSDTCRGNDVTKTSCEKL
jgi:Ca2+-binding RTX toxin-like protein